MIRMNLFTTRSQLIDMENKLIFTKGGRGVGINYELRIITYMLLYIK